MTERLYYHDARLLSFDATVLATGEDGRHAILDRTAFYPTSGGQPHDTGRLGAAHVIDVIDDEQGIVHLLDAPIVPGPVHGEVDPGRRWDHMQQHTAQHLLSALAEDRFGWATVSVHFGERESTIEFATAAVSPAELAELQAGANAAVMAAHRVTVTFEPATDAVAAGLRKPPARAGEIRVITIAGLDRSACGGTHVATTAEIGPILVRGGERIRGHVRVGFLAGGRALDHADQSDAALATLAEALSCAPDELVAVVAKRQGELKKARSDVERLEREVVATRLRTLVEQTPPGPDGIRRMHQAETGDSATLLRLLVQAASAVPRSTLVAAMDDPPTVFYAAGPESGLDAGATLKAVLQEVGGRGGGSPKAAQGTTPDTNALAAVVARLLPLP